MTAPTPVLSAVVVIHDSAPELDRLLASIDDHLGQAVHVIVVDSGSRDAGATLARSRGAEVVELEGNLGFGAANNAGVAHARADVTVLINPDVVLLDARLLELARAVGREDVLAAPRLLRPDGRPQDSAHPRPGTLRALLPALVPGVLWASSLRVHAEPWRTTVPRNVGWAIAACLAGRTTTLRSLGPFLSEDFLFYEDLDLCLRAGARGVPTRLEPGVAVMHTGGHSTRRVYGREPSELLARRRREVIGRRLGSRALALDDASQALTFLTRGAGRALLGRERRREWERLQALVAARRA